jgi:hypothetical protein
MLSAYRSAADLTLAKHRMWSAALGIRSCQADLGICQRDGRSASNPNPVVSL